MDWIKIYYSALLTFSLMFQIYELITVAAKLQRVPTQSMVNVAISLILHVPIMGRIIFGWW